MNTAARILFPHAWFARTGLSWDSPTSGGPVSADTLPPVDAEDASGNAIWTPMGPLVNAQEAPTIGSRKEIWTGTPGRLQLKEEIATKDQSEVTLTCQELSELALQLIFGAEDLGLDTASGNKQFNPLEGSLLIAGYLKIQYYDHANNLVVAADRWGGLNVDGNYTADGDNIEYSFKHKVWYSANNSGVIS